MLFALSSGRAGSDWAVVVTSLFTPLGTGPVRPPSATIGNARLDAPGRGRGTRIMTRTPEVARVYRRVFTRDGTVFENGNQCFPTLSRVTDLCRGSSLVRYLHSVKVPTAGFGA